MTDFVPDIPIQDEDTAEQQARCRTLWLMVLILAFLDATKGGDEKKTPDMTRAQKWRHHRAAIRRRWARQWFLDPWPESRADVEFVADCAGLPAGGIWVLVDRFIVRGEDPKPLIEIYDSICERPALKKFDLYVPFGV